MRADPSVVAPLRIRMYPARCSAVPGQKDFLLRGRVGPDDLVGTEVPPRACRTAPGGHLLDPPRAGTAARARVIPGS
jgi:hypothetical protein